MYNDDDEECKFTFETVDLAQLTDPDKYDADTGSEGTNVGFRITFTSREQNCNTTDQNE